MKPNHTISQEQNGPTLDEAVGSYAKLVEASAPVDVWVAHDRCVKVKLPVARPPKLLVGTLLKDPERNGYYFRPMNWPFLLKSTQLAKRLGLPFSDKTLTRLCEAGFVDSYTPSPHMLMVDVESLWEHLQRTKGEAGRLFWTPARRESYAETFGLHYSGTSYATRKLRAEGVPVN